ncbi:YolD-like family protein [Paenibacillus sp. FSL L8-0708]|uniref:YolD-like family protein n=1 Tax=Paenibacillus sp. FSL L8-0708 TaxID=2975311 RepID=UPI0030F60F75
MTIHAKWNYSMLPKHDEFGLEELGESLQEALNSKSTNTLTVFRMGEVTGKIVKLDAATRRVHVQTENQGLHKINFLEIWGIEPAE